MCGYKKKGAIISQIMAQQLEKKRKQTGFQTTEWTPLLFLQDFLITGPPYLPVHGFCLLSLEGSGLSFSDPVSKSRYLSISCKPVCLNG